MTPTTSTVHPDLQPVLESALELATGVRTAVEPPLADPASAQLRVAVLYATRSGEGVSTERDDDVILAALRRAGLAAESVDITDLSCSLTGRFSIADRANSTTREWDLPDAALMYHGAMAPGNTLRILDQLAEQGCAVINGRAAWQVMTDKWRFFELMDHAGVPTIPTRLVTDHCEAVQAMDAFGRPTVFKTPVGTEGNDVYVVHTNAQLRAEVSDRFAELGGKMLAQPFVESRIDRDLEPALLAQVGESGLGMRNDLRIMTLLLPNARPQVIAAFHRIAQSADQAVNNVAKGSREVQVAFEDLHPADQDTLWQAVSAMPDAQLVGWDLIGHPGERVVMEANSGPGLPAMADAAAVDLVLGPCAELLRVSAERARSQRYPAPLY